MSKEMSVTVDFLGGFCCLLIGIWTSFLAWHLAGPVTNQWWAWPFFFTLIMWSTIWALLAAGAWLTAYDKTK